MCSPKMAFRGDKFLKNISVIGAGAWGTAIANTLIRSGSKEIFIWAREESVMKSINSEGINKVFLQDCWDSGKAPWVIW